MSSGDQELEGGSQLRTRQDLTDKERSDPGRSRQSAAGIVDSLVAEGSRTDAGHTKPIARRIILAMSALGVAGIAIGSRVQSVVGKALGGTGLGGLIPGSDRFQLYTVTNGFPNMDVSKYKLAVTGMVSNELSLTFDELTALPATQLSKDFQCVTGWRVPSVQWTGVLLGDLLDKAGASADATAVLFTSFDGTYTESLSMTQARRPDVIVAYSMLGAKPIVSEHGGPVRLYVAPMYGYKSCKWLSGIQVTNQVVPGYWEQQGYDVDAWIGNSNGRTDAPVD